MKKNLYKILAAIAMLFILVHTQAQVTVYYQVEMGAAMLGEAGGTCAVAPFVPGTDVVEPMGGEYNNWTAPENVPCGTAFTPDATSDMVPLIPGSTIYTIVKDVTPTGDQLTWKYRIDHSWDNDELRGVGDGNRHATVPGGATSIVIYSVFDDSVNTVTIGSGIQNPVWASIQKIYPNPSSDQSLLTYLVLNKANVHVYITNVLGATVKEVFTGNQGLGAHQLYLATYDLAQGMYQVNVRVGNSTVTQKLSVVRQ